MTTVPDLGLGWLPQPPDPQDYKLEVHHPELMASPMKALRRVATLRGRVEIINQASTNSCTGHGTWRAFQEALIRAGLKPWDASPFFIYHCARKLMGDNWVNVDQGAYIRSAIKGLGDFGVSSNATYPKYQPLVTPSQQAFLEALDHQALKYTAIPKDLMTMKTILDSGIPIVGGVNCYENYGNQPNGNWPDRVGAQVGGHCICFIGYNDDRMIAGVPSPWQVEAAGSWSPAFGDEGHHWFKWEYVLSEGSDFWIVEIVEGVAPQPPVPPTPVPTDFDITKVSEADFDKEFNRRRGTFKDINIDLGFTGSGVRWQGHFDA